MQPAEQERIRQRGHVYLGGYVLHTEQSIRCRFFFRGYGLMLPSMRIAPICLILAGALVIVFLFFSQKSSESSLLREQEIKKLAEKIANLEKLVKDQSASKRVSVGSTVGPDAHMDVAEIDANLDKTAGNTKPAVVGSTSGAESSEQASSDDLLPMAVRNTEKESTTTTTTTAATTTAATTTTTERAEVTSSAKSLSTNSSSETTAAGGVASTGILFRVVSFNILEGGRDGRLSAIQKWLGVVQPDAVALCELNGFSEDALRAIAASWGHSHVAFGLTRSGFHVGLTSKRPLLNVSVDALHFRHASVSASIEIQEKMTKAPSSLRLTAVHLTPDIPDARLTETSFLPDPSRGSLLMGDMNSLSIVDARHYERSNLRHIVSSSSNGHSKDESYRRKFSRDQRLDFSVIDAIQKKGWKDPLERAEDDAGVFEPSVPTRLDQALDHMNKEHSMRLDYVFVSQDLLGSVVSCKAVRTEDTGRLSDHYPIMCELNLM